MNESEIMYKGEFTIEQRKAMTAEILKELRKAKKLSQKEVAAHLSIPATTYNTYESGRTEPPIEILVRLSHLYGVSVDIIVQRDRTYKTSDDLMEQLAEYERQFAEFSKQLTETGTDAPNMSEVINVIGKLVTALTDYSQTEPVKNALDLSKQD